MPEQASNDRRWLLAVGGIALAGLLVRLALIAHYRYGSLEYTALANALLVLLFAFFVADRLSARPRRSDVLLLPPVGRT